MKIHKTPKALWKEPRFLKNVFWLFRVDYCHRYVPETRLLNLYLIRNRSYKIVKPDEVCCFLLFLASRTLHLFIVQSKYLVFFRASSGAQADPLCRESIHIHAVCYHNLRPGDI